jgi:hypothetical protein
MNILLAFSFADYTCLNLKATMAKFSVSSHILGQMYIMCYIEKKSEILTVCYFYIRNAYCRKIMALNVSMFYYIRCILLFNGIKLFLSFQFISHKAA